jgi:hypothetical protein
MQLKGLDHKQVDSACVARTGAIQNAQQHMFGETSWGTKFPGTDILMLARK